jgi:hypothetical protein
MARGARCAAPDDGIAPNPPITRDTRRHAVRMRILSSTRRVSSVARARSFRFAHVSSPLNYVPAAQPPSMLFGCRIFLQRHAPGIRAPA